jgi:uncharacterized protein (DUF58 family)
MLLRLFEEEEDLFVYILIDCSASPGLSGGRKFDLARRLAAALAYMALGNLDRAAVYPFDKALREPLPPARGRGRIFKVLRFLEALRPEGGTDLVSSSREFVHRAPRPGLALLVSDLYDSSGLDSALALLRYHRFEPAVLHVTEGHDLNPSIGGDLRLLDCESGEAVDVTVTPALIARYRAAWAEFASGVSRTCASRGVPYMATPIEMSFDDVVLRLLRAGGFVR